MAPIDTTLYDYLNTLVARQEQPESSTHRLVGNKQHIPIMSMTSFQDLSPEIIATIIQHIHSANDLKNARLVNKDLEAYARRELFSTAFLSTKEKVLEAYEKVTKSDRLATLPRCATIWTHDEVSDDSSHHSDTSFEENEGLDPEERYEQALNDLKELPNLSSVLIAFTPDCIGTADQQYYQEVDQEFDDRLEKLLLIFDALHSRIKSANGSSRIRSLTIENLQNEPVPSLTESETFRSVMGQLDELHIQMIQEYNVAGPDSDYDKIELQTFPPHLTSSWLAPIATNLKSLSLYAHTDNWGSFPGNYDFSKLCFPNLETLALGYYTIAYDDQLDWVMSIKSLKTLVLHRCMIVRHLKIYGIQEWGTSTRGWQPLILADDPDVEVNPEAHFSYHGTWSALFPKLTTALPNLQNFAFEYPDTYVGASEGVTELYGVQDRHSRISEVFPQRYVAFDQGTLPTHWPEANGWGQLQYDGYPNYHEETLEDDTKALNALLSVCRSRRKQRT